MPTNGVQPPLLTLTKRGLGLRYWESGWNRFDLCITVFATGTLFVDTFLNLPVTVFFRQIRLFRLFEILPNFRKIFELSMELVPQLANFFTALVLVYYSFAIVGIEIFYNTTYAMDLFESCHWHASAVVSLTRTRTRTRTCGIDMHT